MSPDCHTTASLIKLHFFCGGSCFSCLGSNNPSDGFGTAKAQESSAGGFVFTGKVISSLDADEDLKNHSKNIKKTPTILGKKQSLHFCLRNHRQYHHHHHHHHRHSLTSIVNFSALPIPGISKPPQASRTS